jgi:pyruvate kinase
VWGVKAFYMDTERYVDGALKYSIKTLKQNKLISNGNIVVHASSLPLSDIERVNTIKLSHV